MGRFEVRTAFVAAVVAALASVPAFASTAGAAAFPGRNGKIAFQRDTGSGFDVWIANGDGTHQKKLARSGIDDPAADWSADGTRLAFVGHVRGTDAVFVVDANGKHRKRLTKAKGAYSSPAWSSDGNSIVFSRSSGDHFDVFSMDPDGKHVVNLTNTPDADEDGATPSPDGSLIAYSKLSRTNGDIAVELWVMNADGTNPHVVVTGIVATDPCWSPDGTKLAFTGEGDDRITHIFVANADGSAMHNVSGPRFAASPCWSPDGTKIVFVSNTHDAALDSQITVINADGTGLQPLTDEDGVIDRAPAWQPLPA